MVLKDFYDQTYAKVTPLAPLSLPKIEDHRSYIDFFKVILELPVSKNLRELEQKRVVFLGAGLGHLAWSLLQSFPSFFQNTDLCFMDYSSLGLSHCQHLISQGDYFVQDLTQPLSGNLKQSADLVIDCHVFHCIAQKRDILWDNCIKFLRDESSLLLSESMVMNKAQAWPFDYEFHYEKSTLFRCFHQEWLAYRYIPNTRALEEEWSQFFDINYFLYHHECEINIDQLYPRELKEAPRIVKSILSKKSNQLNN